MKKITKKINIALVCTTLLGGVVLPATSVFNTAIVYAETHVNTSNQPIVVVVYYHGQNLDGTTVNLTERGEFVEFQPGQEIAAPKEFEGYTLTETTYIPPAFSEGILMYVYTQNKPVEQPKDSAQTVSYTVQMIDQDNKVLQSEVRTGIEGVGATISIPQLEGYLFRGYQTPTGSDFSGKQTEISFPIQKDAVITLRYQFIPPIDEIISPEKRAEYQVVYDEFHRTILEAYAVYKQELGTDGIAYDKSGNLSGDLQAIHSELVIDTRLLDAPLGTVLSDDYFISGLAWTDDYWNYRMEQLKENTQTLKTALANIAKSKADVNNSDDTNIDTNTNVGENNDSSNNSNGGDATSNTNTAIVDNPAENGQEDNNQTDTNNSGATTNKQDINSKSANTTTQSASQQSSTTENVSSDKNQKADTKELPKTNSTKSNILSFVGIVILGMMVFIKRYTKRHSR
ncbi:LPXTG cell wall anchor domain-containing protein [Streptococcus suis]|uniref:LPXTG cell wall anchor domain-containing protein n=1 Tax=Streptococcus suis TaxID=1307 RepID=UPI001F067503|nr:LPXTG cell wall anchor domain-containing protein [Streptococcus suis]MCH1674180.1 LPXTG cell wall anchor domain-containing protein [Streptococcus suis]